MYIHIHLYIDGIVYFIFIVKQFLFYKTIKSVTICSYKLLFYIFCLLVLFFQNGRGRIWLFFKHLIDDAKKYVRNNTLKCIYYNNIKN
jgi:hypothetical protein